jgi:hypothetical protein
MNSRVYLVSKDLHGKFQRKIAWFNRLENGLYFDFTFLSTGQHISFHKDGTIWRTSLVSGLKPEKTGYSLPLDDRSVWTQLGISAFRKEVLSSFPILKPSDIRKYQIYEIDFAQFPSDVLNFVVECVHPSMIDNIFMEFAPPDDAQVITIDDIGSHL